MSEEKVNGETTDGRLIIAALGDLHVKETSVAPYRELFAEISKVAQVLVLTGDLTDLGKVREAEILAEDLKACTIPVLAVLGNHDYESDQVDELKAVLRKAGVTILDGDACEIQGVGFVGLKGFAGGFGSRMLGSFGEPAIKQFVAESTREAMRLENAMRSVRKGRTFVVLHYAPIEATVEGEPKEIYAFLGSSRLGETIDRFEVSAVVHGHAHRGVYEGRTPRGAPVYNVAMKIEKPSGKPYALLTV
jgi:Icc-related predicted phosphoesterase